ncbi:membrane integrity-associated transporter subunit PqiC [Pseudoalteromonas sp. LC2018020214]|uniref:PqiC family protein n=1 Tax=Pseudoalteromonas sp. LC2018020214 TaxID=2799564 RepID=UPI0019043EC0|nr:PqiC family protein [Pseudoalteromonas sp. LC2018020214]QQM66474.1 membrane integrity-associated transporter subunit PqiC [Pseudoalteromonas sp. LC2018020214]
MKSLFLTASLLLLLAGCSSSIQTATQYYQFEQPIGASSRNVADTDAQLRIQTVVLRGALNNLGIAMKIDSNQIHAANYNLWGESPDVMLTATAQQTLFNAMPNWMVIKGLPVITELDQQTFYELEYEIHHFNGDMRGNADISGLWRLYYTHPETGRRLISIHNFSQLVPIDDDGYDGLVSTLEATWLNINLNVAKQIEQARL